MKAKKRFRHIAAMLMAIVMLMSSMPMTAFATETEEPTKSMDLIVSSAAETVGNTVQVTISVANNPGIASLKFSVAFDSVLTLTNVEFNSEFGSMVTAAKPYTNPQTITMISPMEDVYANGILATLTFAIDENTENGYVADVTVTYDAKDVFNSAEEPVTLNIVNGTVSLYTGMPGDVDGNGTVNTKDAVALFRHVAGWDIDVDPNALDVNGDSYVDTKDAIMLFRYVSGWEGILLSYSHDHRFSYTEAVDATCTEDGNIAYYYCSICKRYYTDAEATTRVDAENIVVKATGHSFSTEWTHDETHHWYAATCEHTDEVKDKGEHTYGDDKVCDVCTFDSNYLYKLAAPTDVVVAYDLITWTAVPNADSYTVVVNGDYEYTTRNTECSLTSVRNSSGETLFADRAATKQHGQVKVVVYANDNGEYTKSDASQTALYYYVPSAGNNQEATDYGLGRGYNMIETGFYAGMKAGQPVLDIGKLLAIANLTVSKIGGGGETRSYSYTSIDDYTEQHISETNIGAGIGTGSNDEKVKSSFVAGLKADLSYGTSSNYITHQYFCSYVIYSEAIAGTVGFDNLNEDLRVHCLSEQFMKDLRRESQKTAPMSDEALCQYLYETYGTHVALGIVKGGYFVTSYTVWTDSEKDLDSAKDAFALAVNANIATFFNASLDVSAEENHSIEITHESTIAQLQSGYYGGDISDVSADKAAYGQWDAPSPENSANAVPLAFAEEGAVALSYLIGLYEEEIGGCLGTDGTSLGHLYAQYIDGRADELYNQLYSQYTYEPPFDVEVVDEDGKNVLVVDLSMYQASGELDLAGCSYFVDGIFTVYPNMLGKDIDAVRLIGGMDNIHFNKELLNGFTLALKGRWTRDVEIILENFGAAAKSDYGVVDTSAISKTINVTVLYEGINIVKDTTGICYCYVEHEDSSYRFVLTNEEGITWVVSNAGLSEDGIYLPVATKEHYDFAGWINGNQTAITNIDGKLDTTLQLGTETITVYADWNPYTYTITLDNQGAATPGTNEIYLMYSIGYASVYPTTEDFERIYSITIPEKTGYTFGGYYYVKETVDENGEISEEQIFCIDKDGNINNTIDGVAANVAFESDIILYAYWIPATYTVKYVGQTVSAGPGSVVEGSVGDTTHTYGGEEPLASGDNFTCTGKTFVGWNTKEDGTGEFFDPGKKPSRNLSATDGDVITLYAVWTGNTKITLESDSDENIYTTQIFMTADLDAVYIDPDCQNEITKIQELPERTGYVFGGYYDSVADNSTPNPSGTNQRIDKNGQFVGEFKDWTSNKLIALWDLKEFTATWNAGVNCRIVVTRTDSPLANAATGEITSGTTIYYGDVLTITYTANTGYEFTGKGQTSIEVTQNVTASDIWAEVKLRTFTVTYNLNQCNTTAVGATQCYTNPAVANKSKTITYGTSYTLDVPTANYYTFTGWYLADGTKVADANGRPSKNWTYLDNITVYARWSTEYTYIRNVTDLKNIKNNTSGKYLLIADISSVGEWTPISSFSGELIGLGHSISGMKYYFYNGADVDWGMFVTLQSGAVIDGVNFRANEAYYAPGAGGAIYEVRFGYVAAVNYGEIRNCELTSNYITIDGNTKVTDQWAYAGTVVCDNYGTISNCYVAWGGITLDSDTVNTDADDEDNADDKHAVAIAGGVCARNMSSGTVESCTVEGCDIYARICYIDDSGETWIAAAGGVIGENSGTQTGNSCSGGSRTALKRRYEADWGIWDNLKSIDFVGENSGYTGSIVAKEN